MVSDKQVQLIVLCDPLYYLSSGIGLLLAVLGRHDLCMDINTIISET